MNPFTIIVIILVCVVLFTYFYNAYRSWSQSSTLKNVWPPPPIPKCPDYWSENGNTCVNTYMLGTGKAGSSTVVQSLDLTSLPGCSGSNQSSTACKASKCSWAKETNNPWFGVGPTCSADYNQPQCYCPS